MISLKQQPLSSLPLRDASSHNLYTIQQHPENSSIEYQFGHTVDGDFLPPTRFDISDAYAPTQYDEDNADCLREFGAQCSTPTWFEHDDA